MIRIQNVLSAVLQPLNLTRSGQVSLDFFYKALDKAVRKLVKDFQVLRYTETISGTSSFTLSTAGDFRPTQLLNIVFPSTWTLPLERLNYQEMNRLKSILTSGADSFGWTLSSEQPTYFVWNPSENSGSPGDLSSPTVSLELEDSSMLTSDIDIEVTYAYVPKMNSRVFSRSGTLDMGEEYEDYLIAFVSKEMAKRYAPQMYSMFVSELQEEYSSIVKFRSKNQFHTQPQFREYLPF